MTADRRTAPPEQHAPRRLPDSIEPMLARPGKLFDDPRFLFEVKWDGTRAMAFIEGGGKLRILNRRRRDVAWRFPELSFLADLPAGTVLDGEIVCLDKEGRPSFQLLQTRDHVSTPRRAAHSVASCPATYIAFDQLYDRFRPVLDLPCTQRRELLRATIAAAGNGRLVMSEGVVGEGKTLFGNAVARGLEGIVAKRLDSRYEPGRRSGAWVKVKRHLIIPCVVIGFVPEGGDDFGSLIIAAPSETEPGQLTCVGRVGSGFNVELRKKVNAYLHAHLTQKPVIACKEKGTWVEPGLYCTVRCMERTADGKLRAPVFGEVTHVEDRK